MRVLLIPLAILVLFGALGSSLQAQPCGDANDDQKLNVLDMVVMIEYLLDRLPPGEINLANADCDGTTGVSIADVTALVGNLFYMESLDCTPVGTYGFQPLTTDTVFLPYALAIPPQFNELTLVVKAKLTPNTDGLYLPLLPFGPGSSGAFVFSSAQYQTQGNPLLASELISADTAVVLGVDLYRNNFVGITDFLYLTYTRQSAGDGTIWVQEANRGDPLRFAVEQDGQLYTPVIRYYMFEPPPDTLFADRDRWVVSPVVDSPFTETLSIAVTSWPDGVTFRATTDEDWINLQNMPAGYLTAPDTVFFTLDTDGFAEGYHQGVIRLEAEDSTVFVRDPEVLVELYVRLPDLFPWGDLNCDGRANLTDVTVLVGCLFLGMPAPEPCE